LRVVASEVLSLRALNRALLGRQMLLERRPMPVGEALEHLVGMQAQVPTDPYFGLWSRIDGFDPEGLSRLVADGRAVRSWLMRGTIHLVTARDCLRLWPVMSPVLRKAFEGSPFGRDTAGIDRDELVAAIEDVLADAPRTRAEIGRALAERWPGSQVESLGLAATYLVPLVQVPPRGTWGATHRATLATVANHLGEAPGSDDDPAGAIQRYLRAFGPAAPKDVRAWCYRTGLRDPIERLRPRLRTFRDEGGTELLDVEDGMLPDPATPAPVRFLPEYDNALLSHADRSRINPVQDMSGLFRKGTVLVDGFVAGTWKLERDGNAATLAVSPWERWPKTDREEVAAEGERLVAFAAPAGQATSLRFDEDA
jgi:hypothetical protein